MELSKEQLDGALDFVHGVLTRCYDDTDQESISKKFAAKAVADVRAHLRQSSAPAAVGVPGQWLDFMEQLSKTDGGMVNGNKLSARAKELLATAPQATISMAAYDLLHEHAESLAGRILELEDAAPSAANALPADSLRPVEPGALASSIADLDAWMDTDGSEPLTTSQGESVMLVLQEVKRLRAAQPAAPDRGAEQQKLTKAWQDGYRAGRHGAAPINATMSANAAQMLDDLAFHGISITRIAPADVFAPDSAAAKTPFQAWARQRGIDVVVTDSAAAPAARQHDLKTDPAVFEAVWTGAKTHEIRRNDRGFKVGDTLVLRETVHTGEEMRAGAPLRYTGRVVNKTVSHVLSGYGLDPDWVILSFAAQPPAQDGDVPMPEPKLWAYFDKHGYLIRTVTNRAYLSVWSDGIAFVPADQVKAYGDARVAAALASAGKPVMPPFQCWSDNDGDSWREHPADADLVDGLKVGDTYELLAGWESVRATYRVTKAPDAESDDYEVECISHPEDNKPSAGKPSGQDALRPLDDAPAVDGYKVLALTKWEWEKQPRFRILNWSDGIGKVGYTWPCWLCDVNTVQMPESCILGWLPLPNIFMQEKKPCETWCGQECMDKGECKYDLPENEA